VTDQGSIAFPRRYLPEFQAAIESATENELAIRAKAGISDWFLMPDKRLQTLSGRNVPEFERAIEAGKYPLNKSG
jgi:hypothetical protein